MQVDAMAGIGELVDEIVARGRGEHPALVLDDGSALSYRDLSVRIGASAREFAAAGLGRGERVVLIGENGADMVVALFAAIRAGGWAVPLNARMAAAEIDAICDHCQPRLVYCASGSSAEAAAHAEHRRPGAAPATLPQGWLQVSAATASRPRAAAAMRGRSR
jgi:acyl-CoA synthetase (AMP-forming)/AMP-acid ligase II